MFHNAIVRPPGKNFADGLTTSGLGAPDYVLASIQHEQYCAALQRCGLKLTRLEADERHPDSTFVEDVAVITEKGAILTRPGAASRTGEVESMRPVLLGLYSDLAEIHAPGTLDGGDICEAGKHVFIGISERTNQEGGQQLADFLAARGYTSSFVDICHNSTILHLKSGLTYLGNNRLLVIDSLAGHPAFDGYEILHAPADEEYAANCVLINDYVLVASGFPKMTVLLENSGYRLILLNVSEYQKMDGGLSCLSLRF